MKPYTNLTLFFLALIFSTSCEKDKTLNYTSLTIGETEMIITPVEKEITSNEFSVDFDNDGVDDLQFDRGIMAFGPMNQDKIGWIAIPLNDDISFHTSLFTDTLFSCTEYIVNSYPSIPSTIISTIDVTGYVQLNDSCSYTEIEQNHRVKYMYPGESISNQDKFTEGKRPLNIAQIIQNHWTDTVYNDTTYISGYRYHQYPPYWRGTDSRYAIFKLKTKNGRDRLGWIKLTGHFVDEVAIMPK